MLKIYNTLTQSKETFQSIHSGQIGFYVCGVTVYDYCHIGHARTYTSADVMVRYLRARGWQVRYVRNITDIDDKIIKRAAEKNEACVTLTDRFTKAMHDDFDALFLTPPDDEPRATDYIPQMIQLIQTLLEKEHAYQASNGDIYFDVRRFPQYGALSHHDLSQLESGIRVEVADVKRDPLDFVLWKSEKPGEPFFESPFGRGRPGWHIECSAMSMSLLGNHFDIHAGGRDLIFPHHENEIAQSECCSNETFANTWVHVGFLQMDKEKMSKSLGNTVTIRDVLQRHTPEVVRYFLLASHYRSPLVYTEDVLHQAKQALTRLYTALRFLPDATRLENSIFEKQFQEAMDDDFNVPVALSVLFELSHELQRVRHQDLQLAASHGALLKYLAAMLGLLQIEPEVFFQFDSGEDLEEIESLIAARNLARLNKKWAKADEIRDQLLAMGIAIEDQAAGTSWRRN
ncbi:MAG: cysteine--tRNA ligase [Gammaproteobacteria bacterium RIFCSPHIGHO2_12_FULL_42_10]|nr:MAG: cysteine--tRNA ligase [Gammaproteobacteria bacterium RIFCSPHIGHO2_12_FULL_42_10]